MLVEPVGDPLRGHNLVYTPVAESVHGGLDVSKISACEVYKVGTVATTDAAHNYPGLLDSDSR